ncbi:hypothetical protein OHA72_15435 [Dactylosporangium sp. NBC_01737]|uniref:hypothetical protein n=1 Tax=Dactylosporangium sp. NBC_01737 TaxID=2975959 RepID=UPI002E0E6F77|nr:hypothetical protein OHA72_15435 [Dactylosporangium sp. NBC_01737]
MTTAVEDPTVLESPAVTRWTVQERAWKQDLPDLPDDVIALLAPPVVVSASTIAGRAVPDAVATVA